jgi:hypothetical protein
MIEGEKNNTRGVERKIYAVKTEGQVQRTVRLVAKRGRFLSYARWQPLTGQVRLAARA